MTTMLNRKCYTRRITILENRLASQCAKSGQLGLPSKMLALAIRPMNWN